MARQREKSVNNSTEKSTKQQKGHQLNENDESTNSNNTGSKSSTTSSNTVDKGKNKHTAHSKKPEERRSIIALNKWKTLAGCICLIVAVYFGYQGYLETRVNTPFDKKKMVVQEGLNNPELYWGSYRPLSYFGMKTRDPDSLVMGLMWYMPSNLGQGGRGIRHWCDMGDKLDKYGWTHHDGRNFGVQEIHDHPFELKTSFIKYPNGKPFGGSWTARISVKNTSRAWDKSISLIWYVALDELTKGRIKYVSDDKSPEPGVYGETSGLGEFQLKFNPIKGKILHKSYLSTVAPGLNRLKSTVSKHLRLFTDKRGHRYVGLPGEMISHNGNLALDPNFIAIQLTAEVDFTMDIAYKSTAGFSIGDSIPKPLTGREYTDSLQKHLNQFDTRFNEKFGLDRKRFSREASDFGKYALSNMLGGIGYFYGFSKVQSVYTTNPVPYWKSALYTAVPSRSFFPRGFLWDEGFHGLLISTFDIDIELDIISHWFSLMNSEGWIPREQILGVEALEKVPPEFVIQHNTNANPPTFMLTIKKILNSPKNELYKKNTIDTLNRIYPRLQAWFAWYNSTQKGDLPGTYQWRGRDDKTKRELNPKTLTSGLDDFPRASHPTKQERHVDIRCWIAFAASVMYELSTFLKKEDYKYYETSEYLKDNNLLNELHLSRKTNTYSDWGLHTDSVVLRKPHLTQKSKERSVHPHQHPEEGMVRVVLEQPEYKFVDSTFGYVNIFPFLLEILEPESSYLWAILHDIRDSNKLWTPYGLRSLSKSSPLYLQRNTEHDPPYWRGPIWININYLALKALHHYANNPDVPYHNLYKLTYDQLRSNLIENTMKEYKRTGYLWEQYDDTTGEGKGCHPFTGWSSLILLIMAEEY